MLRAIWNEDPDGNVEHILEHDLTIEDVEFVLQNFESNSVSRRWGDPCVFGYTPHGRYILVVFEQIDRDTVYPYTAYDVPEPA